MTYLRWRKCPAYVDVDSDTVISIGDLLWLDTNDAKPASSLAWDTDLATTQEEFHDNFLGVAITASANGQTAPVCVGTFGVYLIGTASASYEIGDLVGPDDDATPLLTDQQVIAVATANLAIGRVEKKAASATTIQVSIVSTVMFGGPQAMA